ncbi:MAG: hypothetical protein R3C59_27870 [Planctomycetaceae bacterium]
MFRTILLAILTTTSASFAQAQDQQFPYKAKVVVAEVYARSGGGDAFYPTQKLTQDSVVTVRRHDAGGWYMIDPPDGSFSWIPTRYVRRTAGDEGEVLENNAVVFVGSSFGDETSVWQRRMTSGEIVTILAERDVDTVSGSKRMYKIAPPQREYRWVPGTAVLPVSDADRARHDRNPYNVPSQIVRQRQQRMETQPTDVPSVVAAPAERSTESAFSPSHQLRRLKQIREEQRELQALDQRFRDMILASPTEWKLKEIEQEYQQLQDKVTHQPIAGQIDLRYPAIRRYEQRKAEFDDLERITSQTEKVDAELMAKQYSVDGSQLAAGQMSGAQMLANGSMMNGQPMMLDQFGQPIGPMNVAGGAFPPGAIPPEPAGSSFNPNIMSGPMLNGSLLSGSPLNIPGMQPSADTWSSISESMVSGASASGGLTLPHSQSTPVPQPDANFALGNGSTINRDYPASMSSVNGVASTNASRNAYIGAGYLQRDVSNGEDRYVLISPTGKVLAQVQPEGELNLEQHIGQSVGVRGSRHFDSQAQTDRIHATSLEPVQLR